MARQHRIGDDLGDERAGQDAPVHLRQRERGVLCRDREIAAQQLHERAADAEALDHGDGRLVVVVEPLPAPAVGRRGRLFSLAGIALEVAEEFLQILSGAEIAAFAADNHHPDVFIDFEPRQRVVHVVVKLRAHGVALVRTVHGEPGDAVVDSHFCAFVFVFSHERRPPVSNYSSECTSNQP